MPNTILETPVSPVIVRFNTIRDNYYHHVEYDARIDSTELFVFSPAGRPLLIMGFLGNHVDVIQAQPRYQQASEDCLTAQRNAQRLPYCFFDAADRVMNTEIRNYREGIPSLAGATAHIYSAENIRIRTIAEVYDCNGLLTQTITTVYDDEENISRVETENFISCELTESIPLPASDQRGRFFSRTTEAEENTSSGDVKVRRYTF